MAPYDEIADWYEREFLGAQSDADPIGVTHALRVLLGAGTGRCLEIGCGTGVHARQVRELGWTPVGVDLSAGMLRHARGRLPVARADAVRLPLRDGCVPAVVAVMVHTDMPDYPLVLREVHRVLEPGGRFIHVGVHPCFCGGFADRTDPDAVVIRPGYLDSYWTRQSWTAGAGRRGWRPHAERVRHPVAQVAACQLGAGYSDRSVGRRRSDGEPWSCGQPAASYRRTWR